MLYSYGEPYARLTATCRLWVASASNRYALVELQRRRRRRQQQHARDLILFIRPFRLGLGGGLTNTTFNSQKGFGFRLLQFNVFFFFFFEQWPPLITPCVGLRTQGLLVSLNHMALLCKSFHDRRASV